MTISPTLGITPIDTAPIMRFGDAASQQLQQLGQQLRNDITTIQTNRQLQDFAQALPTDVDPNNNPDFYRQINSAASQYPLAAHSPVGMSILNQLGKAHADSMQTLLLGEKLNQYKAQPGTNTIFNPVTGESKSTGATPLRPVQGKVVYQKGIPLGTLNPDTHEVDPFDPQNLPPPPKDNSGVRVVGNHVIDINQTDPDGNPKVLYTGKEKPVLKDVGGTLVDASDPNNPREIYKAPEKEKQVSPTATFNKVQQAQRDLTEAEAEHARNLAQFESTKNRALKAGDSIDDKLQKEYDKAESNVRGSQKKVDNFRKTLDVLKGPSDALPGEPPLSPTAPGVDKETAKKFLKQANGDVDKARELAKAAGYAL